MGCLVCDWTCGRVGRPSVFSDHSVIGVVKDFKQFGMRVRMVPHGKPGVVRDDGPPLRP